MNWPAFWAGFAGIPCILVGCALWMGVLLWVQPPTHAGEVFLGIAAAFALLVAVLVVAAIWGQL